MLPSPSRDESVKREVSWNLGLWRGERDLPVKVRLAPEIDVAAYAGGYDYGLTLPRQHVVAFRGRPA